MELVASTSTVLWLAIGVTVKGCTVGQGITGFSTPALGSIATFVAGAAATLKFPYWRLMREA